MLTGAEPLEAVLTRTRDPQLHVLCVGRVDPTTVSGFEEVLARGPGVVPGMLEKLHARVRHRLVDCPAGLGKVTTRAIEAATHVMSPLQAEPLALRSVGQLLALIDRIRAEKNPDLSLLGVVLSMFDRKTPASLEVAETLWTKFPGGIILDTVIPRDETFLEASLRGSPLLLMRSGRRPSSRVFDQLASDVLDRIEPAGREEGGGRCPDPAPRLICRARSPPPPRSPPSSAEEELVRALYRGMPLVSFAVPTAGRRPSPPPRAAAGGARRRRSPAAREARLASLRDRRGGARVPSTKRPALPTRRAGRPSSPICRRSRARWCAAQKIIDWIVEAVGATEVFIADAAGLPIAGAVADAEARLAATGVVASSVAHLAAAIPGNSSALFELHVGEGPFFQLIGFDVAAPSYVVGFHRATPLGFRQAHAVRLACRHALAPDAREPRARRDPEQGVRAPDPATAPARAPGDALRRNRPRPGTLPPRRASHRAADGREAVSRTTAGRGAHRARRARLRHRSARRPPRLPPRRRARPRALGARRRRASAPRTW